MAVQIPDFAEVVGNLGVYLLRQGLLYRIVVGWVERKISQQMMPERWVSLHQPNLPGF